MGTIASIDVITPGGLRSFSATLPVCQSEEESARSMKSGVENAAVGSQRHEEGGVNIVSSGRFLPHWVLQIKFC